MLQFQLLGGLHISRDGVELRGFISRKAQALLVYLALTRRAHFREALQGLLWGDLPQNRAASNLRVTLNNLRRLVPQNLEVTRAQVVFHLGETCHVDVVDFEQLVSQPEISCQQAAANLYRGDLLDGFYVADSQAFDEWLLAVREHLRQTMLQMLHRLVAYHSARGEYRAGIDYASHLLALDPWREEAHRELMRLLALSGQRSAALAQYEQCRRLLAQELGLEPLEETAALYQQIKTWEGRGLAGLTETETRRVQPPTLPFSGREREHAWLLEWWQEARRGAGRLCLVEGEGGIGKTRLVSEGLRYVETQRTCVLSGRCYEFGGSVPYQPIADALRPFLMQTPKVAQALKSSGWLAELSRLLPDLRQAYPDLPEPLQADHETARLRLFEAVARLLKEAARGRMAALFVDDLQWADSSTLDLLHYLVRQLHSAPVWIIGAYRPEETSPSHPLTRLRQGLSRDHLVDHLSLTPLTPGAVAQIARSLFGDLAQGMALGEFLHTESEGNPFMLNETIASLQEQGVLICQPDVGWQWQGPPAADLMPPSVQDVIMQRVGRLSEPARQLLKLAASAGWQFDAPLLQAAAGSESGAVESSLDEWLARRLVKPVIAGYDFSHDKIRAAVYGAVSPPQQKSLHHKIGEALESLHHERPEAVCEALAYHFGRAGVCEKALAYLPLAAAKAASVYANEQALDYYQRALALCPSSDERCWRILLEQADILSLVGKYEAAITACQQVATGANALWQAQAYHSLAQISRLQRDYEAARRFVLESEQAALSAAATPEAEGLRARLLQAQADIEREQTNLGRAQELFEAALAVYQKTDDAHGLAGCFKGLGDILSARGSYSQARQRYEQAFDIFQRLEDKQSAGACLRDIATSSWRLRDYTASRQAALESLEICRAICDRQGEAAALNSLGLSAIVQGDHDETQRCWRASVAIYCELGLDKRAAPGLHNLGISYMDSGNLPASLQCLEQALEINHAAGVRRDQALDLGWLGKLHWLLRDYAAAISCLDRALALDDEIGGGEEQDWRLIWRAAVACESGDLPTAWSCLRQAEQMLEQGCANLNAWDITQWKASAYLAEGKLEAAQQAARQALAEAHTGGADANTTGAILALLGRIHGRLADDQEAHLYFEKALALLPDAAPSIYSRAATLQQYGAFLTRVGNLAQAGACLSEARAIFERIGASGAVTTVQQLSGIR